MLRVHEDKCMRTEIACPNGCGTKGILRKDMFNHEAIYCSETSMKCSNAGCNTTLAAKKWGEHIVNC